MFLPDDEEYAIKIRDPAILDEPKPMAPHVTDLGIMREKKRSVFESPGTLSANAMSREGLMKRDGRVLFVVEFVLCACDDVVKHDTGNVSV
jgi:hypothetical protein